MKSKKIIIVIFLIVLEIGIFFLSIKSFNNKFQKLDVNSNRNNVFAFYVQNGNNYVQSSESAFPDLEEYTYNSEMSYCVDNTGKNYENASISYENNEVQVVTEKSVYCYLYFDVLKTLYNVIKHDADPSINTPIAEEYDGTYNYSPNKTIYYYSATQSGLNHDDAVNSIMNHWNVLFGGFCWQMLRTTESGGVKLLYNGEPTGNSCPDGRDNLIGKSKYNSNNDLFSKVGYMYNNNLTYELNQDRKTTIFTGENNYLFGYSFEERVDATDNKGKYTLVGNVQVVNETNFGSKLKNVRYTCFDQDGICDNLYYVYSADNSSIYYINLKDDGDKITDAVNNMIGDKNTNTESSTIKTLIDDWYSRYILEYNDYIDINEVYCNDRRIESYGSFNPDNDFNTKPSFEVDERDSNLNCPNRRDAFTYIDSSVGNNQLLYPIGLMTVQEMYIVDKIDDSSPLRGNENSSYYLMTPYSGLTDAINTTTLSSVFIVDNSSLVWGSTVDGTDGVRPAIALKSGIEYTSGDGSKTNPFIIE